ncbi:coniferyl-alcohol dehydrogenase [Thalassovita taeanensis]|uniref:NAD(P)-dependent dehydrogenase, short-chain alcohol dehydrogenase family n=1 Tax=Thalassovita taeanensis TaxID=657014 RepID=A0A1H9IZH5_9RHOB|nr:coniferyl-alcohol dehydrogenase [Thalassovita taeanensis]SEQ79887.1 NAD(P)-dependent dehydrogenase, short-chain alcohol dehydrogenase family [Thalassovita taeanensis]
MHNGKTYIVTGAASGIGAETCRVLRADGARVIGIDRHEAEDVDEMYLVDLSDKDAVVKLVADLPNDTDGLANIAGVPPTAPADVVLRVNLVGLRALTEGLVDKLADGASIVNLASLAGNGWQTGLPQVKRALALDFDSDISEFCEVEDLDSSGRSYFLGKEALLVWTFQNRWTWRDRGIRINAVSPGPVDTPILGDFAATLGKRFEENMQKLERAGTAEDIAPAVGFLLSDQSKWIRGTNLAVDGGMSAHFLSAQHGF